MTRFTLLRVLLALAPFSIPFVSAAVASASASDSIASVTASATGTVPASKVSSVVSHSGSAIPTSAAASSSLLSSGSLPASASSSLASSLSLSSLPLPSFSSFGSASGSISGSAISLSSGVSSGISSASASTSAPVVSGFSQQPPGNDASSHPFTPFPSHTEQPIAATFVPADPLNPPPASSDPSVIPDFNQAWTIAWAKAKNRIAPWTIEQKVNLTTGVGWMGGRCVGNTPPIPEQAWQGLCLEDSPLGVRFADFITVFPTGINTAATWNRNLMRQRGLGMGQEHRGKGVNIALGPMMNIGRIAQGGRNWEGFGADPFLAGETAFETVIGMQQGGVQANAKHYLNNEQEHERTAESSNVDDRTEHEIYAHPFLRSVMAGVASVMCSYNLINNTYACENDRLMNQILKNEYGFQGFIMSDWSAQHSTLSAVDGLDMSMPGDITFNSGTSYWGQNLTDFVRNGSISEARLDDMATRIMASWYFLHQDNMYPPVNFNAFNPVDPATNERIDVQDDHAQIVRSIGAASTILLKNNNNTLPLQKPRALALIGSDAGPAPGGPNQFGDHGGDAGILAIGWGSGTANFTYLVSPLEAIQLRARQDRTTVNWHLDDFDTDGAGNIAIQADVALVFINADSGEDYITVDGNEGDRKNLTAWHGGDNLVHAVAKQNKNTVVVVHSVGPLIVEPWIEHPNVSAVLWAGAAGQETGNSLVDVLYGAVNPSGRLPYTIAKDPADYPAQLNTGNADPILQIDYTEGLFIDYRHFDANNIAPRFEFGFGLSYTTFAYSNMQVIEIEPSGDDDLSDAWEDAKPMPNGFASSVSPFLHRPAYRVTFNVRNSGSVAGTEIAQLYVNHPAGSGEPPSILKGFTDVELNPGQTKQVAITLSRYDLSMWDVVHQTWRRPQGIIKLTVGASSRDKRLTGRIPE